jgi:dolichol kinase
MAWNFILISVSIVFIANAFGQLYYALQLRKKFSEEHNFNNSVGTFILWFVVGVLYPYYFWPYTEPQTFFEGLSVFFICIFTPVLISVILLYQYLFVIKKTPRIKEQRTINLFLSRFDNKNERHKPKNVFHTLGIDIYRKGLHLFPAIVIILLWIFAVYVWEGLWEADQFWGISGEQFGRFLIITAGYSGILIFGALDYVRLSYIFPKKNLFHFLPNNVLDLLSKSMKRQEIFEFTKPATLVMAFTPIFFFPFGIFASAALIATIGDGAASIMGLKFGKIRYPKTSNKTIIGYVSGAIVSFLVSFISLYIFQPIISITEILILSAIGGIAFLLVDLSNLNIDDNILNPIVCGLVMGFGYYLFF